MNISTCSFIWKYLSFEAQPTRRKKTEISEVVGISFLTVQSSYAKQGRCRVIPIQSRGRGIAVYVKEASVERLAAPRQGFLMELVGFTWVSYLELCIQNGTWSGLGMFGIEAAGHEESDLHSLNSIHFILESLTLSSSIHHRPQRPNSSHHHHHHSHRLSPNEASAPPYSELLFDDHACFQSEHRGA